MRFSLPFTLSLSLFLCAASLSAQVNDQPLDGKVAAKSAWLQLTPEQRTETMHFAEPFKDYLRHAKSAALSAAELIRLARAAGFEDFTTPSQVKPGARLIIANRGRGALCCDRHGPD